MSQTNHQEKKIRFKNNGTSANTKLNSETAKFSPISKVKTWLNCFPASEKKVNLLNFNKIHQPVSKITFTNIQGIV